MPETIEKNQPIPQAPEIASVGESKESEKSKPKRGGKRPGAGRKPNYAKRLLSGVKPVTAAEALEGVDVRAIVRDLLKNGSRPVKLQTLTVLWDRIFGKPKQEIGVSGGLVHTHTRDPLLASLRPGRAYQGVRWHSSEARPACLGSRPGCPAKSNRIKDSHRSCEAGVRDRRLVKLPFMEKRPLPVTSCTVCRKPGHNIASANLRCPHVYVENRKRKRCRGVMQSAIGVDDWMECPTCKATGSEVPEPLYAM